MNNPTLKDQTSLESFGIKVAQARTAFNISQRQLALSAKITQTTISKLESGSANPTIETMEKIADALHMKLSISLSLKGKYDQ